MTDSTESRCTASVSLSRQRIQRTGAQETLIIPLYAPALDYRSRHSILHDRKADELVRSMDIDFERLRTPGNTRVLAARARQFDEWVREFIAVNPSGVVLNLGCGLDPRISRIDPPGSILWIDLDFPEVIELRRGFFSEHDGYRMIASSVTTPGWIETLPTDRHVLAVAEGVFEYLTEDEVKAVVRRLIDRFGHGQILSDVMNSYALQRGNESLQGKTDARLRWAVDDLRRVDGFNTDWKRTATLSVLGLPFLPFRYRLLYRLASLSPNLRNAVRMVRYEF